MAQKGYKVEYTFSSRNDIRNMKKYILDNFKYRELGENFSKKIREAVNGLKVLPTIHNTTGFVYRDYDIYEATSYIFIVLYCLMK